MYLLKEDGDKLLQETGDGILLELFKQALAGTLNLSGTIGRAIAKSLAGTLNFSGIVSTIYEQFKSIAGTLNLSGAVSTILKIFKSLAGTLTSAGVLGLLWRIIGAKDVSVDGYLGVDTFHLSKFAAEFTGLISKIRIYSYSDIDVKVAIYSDIGGEPSSLLAVVNTPTAVVAGWNTIAVSPSVSISVGTNYWLAFNSG